MNDCLEKFIVELVAQAFQPVRLRGAGETPALRFFHNLRVSQGLMNGCSKKLKKKL
jgi:hypothetical protein